MAGQKGNIDFKGDALSSQEAGPDIFFKIERT